MSRLLRRKVQLSASRVVAIGTTALLLTALGFVSGLQVGKAASPEPPALPLVPDEADDALVELLARIQAGATAGEVERLTFPDSLVDQEIHWTVPNAGTGGASQVTVSSASWEEPPNLASAQPEGEFTLRVRSSATPSDVLLAQKEMLAAGEPAWIQVVHVDGEPNYHLNVGGWSSEKAALASPQALAHLGEVRAY